MQVGLPCAGNTQLCTVQNVRGGSPGFVVTLSLANAETPIARLKSDQPAATAQSVTKPIQPGVYYTQAIAGGTSTASRSIRISGGTTSVTVTGPAGVLTMTTYRSAARHDLRPGDHRAGHADGRSRAAARAQLPCSARRSMGA